MAAKPIKSLELHYTMIQFLIMADMPWLLNQSKQLELHYLMLQSLIMFISFYSSCIGLSFANKDQFAVLCFPDPDLHLTDLRNLAGCVSVRSHGRASSPYLTNKTHLPCVSQTPRNFSGTKRHDYCSSPQCSPVQSSPFDDRPFHPLNLNRGPTAGLPRGCRCRF